MTSPISASISMAASPISQLVMATQNARGNVTQSNLAASQQQVALVSSAAAERSTKKLGSDDDRAIDREEARTEGSFSAQDGTKHARGNNETGGKLNIEA